jgi:NhaA family Na+:H+ antiporter
LPDRIESGKPFALPDRPVERWMTPVRRLLHIEAASGVFLLFCTVVALVLANSPWSDAYVRFWKTPVVVSIGGLSLSDTLGHLIVNDMLMTIFFFVVGLEIKQEIVAGELRDPRQAILPIFAAAGGMIVPAAVYLALQWGEPGQRGWAIPMATDIAFVVGFLALFGRRAPLGLKILLLALAIVDDLGAVLIIAIVFSKSIAWGWIATAVAGFLVVTLLNRIGVRKIGAYVVVGMVIWFSLMEAGIHPTVGGVMLGVMTPASAWVGDKSLAEVLREAVQRISCDDDSVSAQHVEFAARESISPLQRLHEALHPWVAFAIMPAFALANAGVPLDLASIREPVALAVAAGLTIGKPAGIVLFSLFAVRLGFAKLPKGVSWPVLAGGACLAGIGFTMSLFLNALAFPEGEYAALAAGGKIGTLLGSVASAVLGGILLIATLTRTVLE